MARNLLAQHKNRTFCRVFSSTGINQKVENQSKNAKNKMEYSQIKFAYNFSINIQNIQNNVKLGKSD